jgi:hypothetical protein
MRIASIAGITWTGDIGRLASLGGTGVASLASFACIACIACYCLIVDAGRRVRRGGRCPASVWKGAGRIGDEVR